MPLTEYSLETIRDVLPIVSRRPAQVLMFSHLDVLVPLYNVEEIFGDVVRGKLQFMRQEDADRILDWHKACHLTSRLVDTRHLFSLLGCDLHTVDLTVARGGEHVHDLSLPLPEDWRNQFDIVIDNISHQCFNIAQCMSNSAKVCKVGGYVLHFTPVQMVNCGFWNISPTVYPDFYESNGFAILRHNYVVGIHGWGEEVDLDAVRRHRDVSDDTMHIVVAQKLVDMPCTTWPIMRKFRQHPNCRREG